MQANVFQDAQVRRDCLKRVHQQALSLLLQEIEVVIANSVDQWHALLNFSSAMDQGSDESSSGQGRGATLVDECVRSSQDRLETFRELAQQTRDLGIYVSMTLSMHACLNAFKKRTRQNGRHLSKSCSSQLASLYDSCVPIPLTAFPEP